MSAVDFASAFSAGAAGNDNVRDLVVDSAGNTYVVGKFVGTVDLDPIGTAKSMRYVDGWNASAETLVLDGLGGLHVAGWFRGTYDFDPGLGTFGLTSVSADAFDAFVWKLDTSGSFVWAGQLGGSGVDEGRALDVDPSGSIYVGGAFQGTADFDPGLNTSNLTSAGGYDLFVTKLTQTGSLSLPTGSAATSFANLLTVSVNSNTSDSAARTKATQEVARPRKRIDWTPTIDAALEEIDYNAWSKIVAEIAFAVG